MGKKKIKREYKLYEWQKNTLYEEKECPRCHKVRRMTVDHIIPKQFLEWLGLMDEVMNDEENFEYMCEGCNKWKANRIDITHPKTKELLVKYIDKL